MAKKDTTTEIAPQQIFTDDELFNITDFGAALEALKQRNITPVRSVDELGNGFSRTDNKAQFVGVPLMLVQWIFRAGDQTDEYVEVSLMTRDSVRYTVTDGGSGIYQQIRDYTDRTGQYNGMLVEGGFTCSEYQVCNTCKKPNNQRARVCRFCDGGDLGWGKTFYLAM